MLCSEPPLPSLGDLSCHQRHDAGTDSQPPVIKLISEPTPHHNHHHRHSHYHPSAPPSATPALGPLNTLPLKILPHISGTPHPLHPPKRPNLPQLSTSQPRAPLPRSPSHKHPTPKPHPQPRASTPFFAVTESTLNRALFQCQEQWWCIF